jgi:hypothetical protein
MEGRETGSGCARSGHHEQLGVLEQLDTEHMRCPVVPV